MDTMKETAATYMKKIDGGSAYFVAWPLATPPHQYGDWALVSLLHASGQRCNSLQVQFHRTLSSPEISAICSAPYLWWGMKVLSQPWALVQCQPGVSMYTATPGQYQPVDSLRNTGV